MSTAQPSSRLSSRTGAPIHTGRRLPWRQLRSPLLASITVLLVGLTWSWFGGWRLEEESRAAERTRFEKMTERLRLETERRMHTFEYGLRAARGAFSVSRAVERREFRTFVQSMELERDYPGAAGLGYVQRVRRDDLETFAAVERLDGAPGFKVTTGGGHADAYVTKFMEPAERTASTLGLDIAIDPARREAAERAMLTGEATISAPLSLSEAGGRRGCVYFLPVYRPGSDPVSEEDRRRELVGWVCAPIVIDETLKGVAAIFGGRIDLEVYEGTAPSADDILHDEGDRPYAAVAWGPEGPALYESTLMRIGGRIWTVWTGATSAFEPQHQLTPLLATIGGCLITCLVSFVVLSLGTARARAVALAGEMTRELRGSERRFRAIADASPAMMWTSGEDGSCTYTNRGWREFTGAAMAECLGPGWSSFIHPDDQDRATDVFIRAVRERLPFELELRLRSAGGAYRWCRFHAAPNLGDEGAFHGLVAVVFDIHDQHGADRKRLHQMQVQNEMSDVARVGGWEYEPHTGETAWTAQMYEIFEVPSTTPPDLASSLACFPDGGAHTVAALIERATETGEGFDYTLPFVTAKGRHLWVRGRGRAERRADGTVRLYGALQDVTESHNAGEALRDERLRLKLFVEHAPAAIAMFDNQMRYIAVSRRWLAEYALKEGEVIGRSHYEVFPNIPDQWKQVHRRCLAGAVETSSDDVWRPAGWDHDQHLRWEVRPWTQADGSIGGVMMCTADISAEKQRETELARMCMAAEAANRAKGEFLANMSHEIRTPLTSIMGYADLLRDEGDAAMTPERRAETINTIRNAGHHLMSVINNILDLSKIEADKMTVARSETPLNEVLTEIESLIRPRAAEKGLAVSLVLDSPLPERIVTEPTFLRQILTNLATNAVKFTERGSVVIRAAVVPGGAGQCLRVDIEDTGAGLTPQQVAKLFEPFSQGDSGMSRRFGGAGLGLTIGRRLAALLGGDVMLHKTEPGVGSIFRVELPLEAAPGCGTVAGTDSQSRKAAAAPQGARLTGRVLLAEDGPDNQRLITLHLKKAGATVDVAENGAVALAMLDKAAAEGKPYDLLVSDMQMPEMDGYTLARTLRSRGCSLAIVAVTAHAMAEDREKCLAAGCDDYDSKPVDRLRLLSMCQRWLGATSPLGTHPSEPNKAA